MLQITKPSNKIKTQFSSKFTNKQSINIAFFADKINTQFLLDLSKVFENKLKELSTQNLKVYVYCKNIAMTNNEVNRDLLSKINSIINLKIKNAKTTYKNNFFNDLKLVLKDNIHLINKSKLSKKDISLIVNKTFEDDYLHISKNLDLAIYLNDSLEGNERMILDLAYSEFYNCELSNSKSIKQSEIAEILHKFLSSKRNFGS